jgi:hypothetical protein
MVTALALVEVLSPAHRIRFVQMREQPGLDYVNLDVLARRIVTVVEGR